MTTKRGGYRPNAGRKKSAVKLVRKNIMLTAEDCEKALGIAKTLSEAVRIALRAI